MWGFTAVTGSCKFCGQVATRKALEEWSQEEIDELATEICCIKPFIRIVKVAHTKADTSTYEEQRGNMPTKDTEKIRNAAVYIDGKAIKRIQEIELLEISTAKEKFIDKLKKLIRIEIFVFMAKRRMRRR